MDNSIKPLLSAEDSHRLNQTFKTLVEMRLKSSSHDMYSQQILDNLAKDLVQTDAEFARHIYKAVGYYLWNPRIETT